MIVGITGNIGSGKTTVAKIFKKYGYYVIDADKIGHEVLNGQAYKKILENFGERVLNKDKKVDRRKLANIVFNDEKKLNTLTQITLPLIMRDILEEIKNKNDKNIVLDAALIIESGLSSLVDKLIVVKINKEVQIKRLLNKGKYTQDQIKKIINAQMPQKEKLKYADYVIDNNGSLAETRMQVCKIIKLQ